MVRKSNYGKLEYRVEKSKSKTINTARHNIPKLMLRLLFFIALAFVLFVMPSLVLGAKSKNILILNSYHKGFEWTDAQVYAAKQVLLEKFRDIELYVEYMDTKRIYTAEYIERLMQIYKLKYKNVKFDAIITTDDNALKFVVKYHEEVFAKAPVSFCGINDYQEAMFKGSKEFTGLVEVLDIKPTIDLALKLHPGTRKVVVIVDNTSTGIGQRKDVTAVARQYENLKFEYLKGEDLTNQELFEKLQNLPRDSIVLLTVWLRDKNNDYLPTSEGGPLISSNATVPVYGIIDMYMGHGITGGKLLNSRTHGKTAAEIALRILDGERPSDIPVIIKSTNPYMFDYQQLDRWGISLSALPEGSVVTNKPFSIYEEYKSFIWRVITFIIVLFIAILFLIHNIMQRRRAEEKLRHFRRAVDGSSDAIGFSTPEGLHFYQNKAFGELFGDIGDDPPATSYVDESKGREVFQAIMSGDQWTGEIEMYSKAKDPVNILLRAYAIKDQKNKVVGLVGVHTDVTESKRSEQALRESEKRYRELFENEQDALMVFDAETKLFEDANQATLDLYGYTKSEFFKLTPEDISAEPEETIKTVESIVKEIGSQRIPLRYQQKKDGTVFPVEITSGIFEIKGRRKIIGAVRDISNRKRAEDALKKERDRAQMYLDVAGVIFVALDAEGKVVLLNRKGCEILGYEEQEIVGKPWFDHCLSESMRNEVKSVYDKLMQGVVDAIEYYENPVLTKKGKERHIAWHNALLRNEKGDIIGTFSSGEDITDRKRAEAEGERLLEQLRQAYKMEAIGTLAGGIAHDFNNILASVIGYAELALDDAAKGTLQHENLQGVLVAGNRAKDLVKQILTFSRQVDLEQKPVQVKFVVKEALKLLRASIPSTVEIKQNIQSDALILGDSTQIHQVLMNLCTNAAHAMEDKGGLLTVNLADVELDSEFLSNYPDLKPGQYINLTVTDTGHGIPPAVLEKIFDPFFTTKEKEEGTGMGLSVVHGIVLSHGGTIYAYSEPGIGSTFKVFLPAIERHLEPEDRIEKPIPIGTERILFIDDEPTIVNMGKQILNSLGYDVATRTSSIEALELFKAQEGRFDLVITDMTMPKMTGEVLAKELMSIRPDIPVILCTGFSARMDEKKAMDIGIRAFISKPILKREIAETIRAVLDG
jgi:two-component system cell cycle sensor histidine kinase/response regulator CckA